MYVIFFLEQDVKWPGNSNWGLTEHELTTIPPALVRGFMKTGKGFGLPLPGNFGRLLMRGEANSELYGPLQEEFIKGQKAGTDVWIHKNRSEFIRNQENTTSSDALIE